MFSVLLIDASLCIEIITQWYAEYFLIFATVAGIGKWVSQSAASASRTGLHRSFQLRENMADITARSVSQSNAANLIGGAAGVFVSWVVEMNPSIVLSIFFALSCTNTYVCYKSLSAVPLRSLSINRAENIVLSVLRDYKLKMDEYHTTTLNTDTIPPKDYIFVPSPSIINRTDTFIRQYHSPLDATSTLKFSPSFDSLLQSFTKLFAAPEQSISTQVHMLRQFYSPFPFFLSISPSPKTDLPKKRFWSRFLTKPAPYTVMILYEFRATSEDVMLGYLFATTVRNSIKTWYEHLESTDTIRNFEFDIVKMRAIIIDALAFIRKVGREFTYQLREEEWLVDHIFVEPDSQARVRLYDIDEEDNTTLR
jgi:hypothetical protein